MTQRALSLLLGFLAFLGRAVLGACRVTGEVALFAAAALSHLVRPPFHGRQFARHFVEFAYFSLALQSHTGFARFNAEGAVASVVVLSVTRELGPVLAGLMVAGRVGAAIAAELGTMRVTDQIDALTTLSTDPMKYLVTPRLLAATLAMPLLVLVADIIGVMGGFLVGTFKLGFAAAAYLDSSWDVLEPIDVISGLVKAAVFGFVIALMGSWCGYNSQGGAQGVGQAATRAVVAASILILALDYALTAAFFAS
jgi:phospholipid/cholesterol/gamma-HCH transport system permease protein